ncbi:MAG: DUF465 domain-containing protein [Nitrospira sp.]|nr:DUF465 domain-containing protein [Nitrospira sp.]
MLTDNQITALLRQSSKEFRDLEERHHQLDAELNDLQRRHALTPQDELVKKQIQKEKLAKKDRLAELIRLHREKDAPTSSR